MRRHKNLVPAVLSETVSEKNKNLKIELEKTQMKKLIIICAVVSALILAVSSPALAEFSVALVPDTLNVTTGSPVTVSVNMSDSPGFTMTAISAVILYDPTVFTYMDPVVQGAFLNDNWAPMGAASSAGAGMMQLRVTAIDWTDFSGEVLAAGNGTLFTFTLQVNAGAPLGPSALSWGDASGSGNGPVGFCYGDADFQDVVLPSSGASINVTPEPATVCLLGLGALSLIRKKR